MNYVIADWTWTIDRDPELVLRLPDAEHVHVTRHPDGTITAVPMRQAAHGENCQGAWGRCSCGRKHQWVDSPGGDA